MCPLLEAVVSDRGLSRVTASNSDGYCDQGSCLQVVPQKLFDDLGDLQALLRW